MPSTPDMRRRVDQIRDYLYGGGYPDPLTNAEQLSFLFFFYMIEGIDAANLRQARATGRDYTSLFAGEWTIRNPLNAPTGEKDEIVPKTPIRRFVGSLPPECRRRAKLAWYENGYHMLLRDLEGPIVAADVASWVLAPTAPLPSGADHASAEAFSQDSSQLTLNAH